MKESRNQSHIPNQAIIRAPDVLSNNPEGVALQLNDFFNRCGEALKTRELLGEELKGVSMIITHVMDALDLDYAHPIVNNGLNIIRSHFVKVFGLEEPTVSDYLILQKVSDERYFEGGHIDDEELEAFVLLEDRFADEFERELASRGESLPELDFSGLINLGWKPK